MKGLEETHFRKDECGVRFNRNGRMTDKSDTSPYFPEYFENYLKPKKEENNFIIKPEFTEKVKSWHYYLRGTSLDGFGQVFYKSLNWKVKLFWVSVVVTCFVTSVLLLLTSFQLNSETPTVTVIDNLFNPVWNHQFPAVTVCNNNRISLSAATNLANKL